jgi:ribonuclease-3
MDLTKYGIDSDNPLLKVALTHSSYANEHRCEDYERLEFLGDAVLELVMSEYFYKNTKLREGEMSKKRSSYVCEEALDVYAQKINLKDYVYVGHGIEANNTIIADIFEAVIAVIYLNSGFNQAKNFIMDVAKPYIESKTVFLSDYKSYLQELVQTNQKSVEYNTLNVSGPAHDRTFEVEVVIDGITYAKGIGKSKKAAQQEAAKKAIELSAGGNK